MVLIPKYSTNQDGSFLSRDIQGQLSICSSPMPIFNGHLPSYYRTTLPLSVSQHGVVKIILNRPLVVHLLFGRKPFCYIDNFLINTLAISRTFSCVTGSVIQVGVLCLCNM